jgi:hypothetical protein
LALDYCWHRLLNVQSTDLLADGLCCLPWCVLCVVSLIERGKLERGEKVLQRIRGTKGEQAVRAYYS